MWNLEQAVQNGILALICVDHQRDFDDTAVYTRHYGDPAAFASYSARVSAFHQQIMPHSDITHVTVLMSDYQTGLADYDAKIATWYDDTTLSVTNKTAFDDFLQDPTTGFSHAFDATKNICLKNKPSCFNDTQLLDFLKDRGKTHVLFYGGWLDACVRAGIDDALEDGDMHVGVIRDVSHPSCSYQQKRIDVIGDQWAMRALFDDRVLMTDTQTVVRALKSKPVFAPGLRAVA